MWMIFFLLCQSRIHCVHVTVDLFCFVASKGGASEYNRLCGCVSNNIQAINKNGIYIAFHQTCMFCIEYNDINGSSTSG